MSEQEQLVEGIKQDILRYINATPQLLSLLYDMDLIPEQLEQGSKDFNRMMVLAVWHRHELAPKVSP